MKLYFTIGSEQIRRVGARNTSDSNNESRDGNGNVVESNYDNESDSRETRPKSKTQLYYISKKFQTYFLFE